VFRTADRSFFVTQQAGTPLRIFRVDPVSGARQHWKDLVPADRAGLSHVRWAFLSADASAYAYQYRRWFSELYVVEGLK